MPADQPEILAPAGNWECVLAAVANGADAVYFGLEKFNARMRADNFRLSDLAELVPFLHARGVRAYVALNVLIFPRELPEALEYVAALDAAGVDGVIVQDMGLAALMAQQRRAGRWQLELHISTQMTVCSPEAVRLVDELFDPEQIVLARELSLREIEACARATGKRIEVFCHGALCVAYSGQCLTSESLGCRSANRGECAQACRLPYRLEVDGRVRDFGERRYLFSPQDLCALSLVPEMLAAGVHSFKIEGRLKTPEYVAAVTRAYRRALDAALRGEPLHKAAAVADVYAMQMAFSRGFSTGWLEGTHHPRLTHGRFGKKRGAFAGRISRCGSGWVELESAPAVPVAPGDGFVLDAGQDRNDEQGGRVWKTEGRRLFFHGKGSRIDWAQVRPGQLLWKTADPALEKSLRASWRGVSRAPQAGLELLVEGKLGEPLALVCGELRVLSRVLLQRAEKRALSPEVLEAQLGRLGGTGFSLSRCICRVEPGLMLPLSELNRMRRELVALLPPPAAQAAPLRPAGFSLPQPAAFEPAAPAVAPELAVLCREEAQAFASAAAGVPRLYLDFTDLKTLPRVAAEIRRSFPGVQLWPATLRIMKPHEAGYFKYITAAEPDGVLVRNLGAAEWWRDKGLPLVGDFSLNAANAQSVHVWRAYGLRAVTASYDLNAAQLEDLLACGCGPWLELTLHQHMPLFHSEHCVFCTFLSRGRNFMDCGRPCEQHRVRVVDRAHARHFLRSDEGCRNTLFNARAQTAARCAQAALLAGVPRFRLELLEESAEQTQRLLELYRALLAGRLAPAALVRSLGVLDRPGVTEIEA
ncbi:MAG: U32 family peptidase [Akkermansiaceae bacterium]|nr:U32 family peptidase [Akkermansiaceae bacterium]